MIPEGIPKPNKKPLYPQEKACLMCPMIVVSEDGEGESFYNINEVEICSKTAEELEWLE